MSFFAIDSVLPNSQPNRSSHGSYLKASGLYCSTPTLSHDTFRSASQLFFFREVKRWPESGRGHAEMKWNCSQISSTTITSLLRCLRSRWVCASEDLVFLYSFKICSNSQCYLQSRMCCFPASVAAGSLAAASRQRPHGQFHFLCG